MSEPFDVYIDSCQITSTPLSGLINLHISTPEPSPGVGVPAQTQRIGTVRMSVETMKVLAFILHRQIKQHETSTGMNIAIPKQTLEALQISSDEWQIFWEEMDKAE
jgi:hypothetical protein